MEFAAPHWFWLLLAAPAACGLAALAWRRRLEATRAWSSRGLWNRLLPGYRRGRLAASVAALGLAVGGCALALTQPRWGEREQRVEREGVDVVFVLDTSLSMATGDLKPNRLWVAQTLIRQMVQRMPANRVALVQAEGDGMVMAPLTSDGAVLDLLLDAVLPGSLPTPGTELAPALRRAMKLFPDGEGKHRAMVVLSDGEDHGKGTQAIASELRDAGIVVFAVGVGTLEGMPLMPSLPGQETQVHRDRQGRAVVSQLVEENLEQLARTTDGAYLRATSAGAPLETILEGIDGLERRTYGAETVESLEERFQWPLALGIVALFCHLGLAPFLSARETP
ncbi:MAG: VWA domain-containing protein [Acidobacteriota bacterium]